MGRWLFALAAVLLLGAGCAAGPSDSAPPGPGTDQRADGQADPTPPEQPSVAEKETGSPTAEGPANPPTAAPDGPPAELSQDPAEESARVPSPSLPWAPQGPLADLIRPAAPGHLERVQYAPGAPIDRPGIFFMAVETGAVEGWVHAGAGAPPSPFGYAVSPDNRWVKAEAPRAGYQVEPATFLIDRTTGAIWQWESNQAWLRAAQGDTLVLEARGRLWLAGPDLTDPRPLPLETGPFRTQALLSPDSRTLMVLQDRRLYRVETATGAVEPLLEVPLSAPQAPAAGDQEGEMRLVPTPGEQGVVLLLHVPSWSDSPEPAPVRVWRYSWQGEELAAGTLPGWEGLSPDGRLVYWVESLGPGAPAVTVADALDFTPRFRVKGAFPCAEDSPASLGRHCWLADSSGLVVRVRDGYRLLRSDSSLVPLSAAAGAPPHQPLIPAPDRPDRLAAGAAVVNAVGERMAAPSRGDGPLLLPATVVPPWGRTSGELRFVLGAGGKGRIYIPPPPLDPVVERPPFPAVLTYTVNLPPDDCLNLRQSYSQEASVIRCLPGGSRLQAAAKPGRINKGWVEFSSSSLETTDWGEHWWLYVRTAAGERGWVAYSPEFLALATGTEARTGALPADPFSARLEDEAANRAYWLQVALGERACGPPCVEVSLEEAVLGLVNRCAAGVDPYRTDRRYDPARHGPTLERMEAACGLLQQGMETLGHPQESPQWREQVRAALQALMPAASEPSPGAD